MVAEVLRSWCSAPGYETSLDMGALTELLRAIASSSHGLFEGALRQVIAGAEARLRGQEEEGAIVKLKVGPVKRADRIAVKVGEYREEKDEDTWPFSQFMSDILRASFIVGTAEEMVVVWESLLKSPDFEVVRLEEQDRRAQQAVQYARQCALQIGAVRRPDLVRDAVLSSGGI